MFRIDRTITLLFIVLVALVLALLAIVCGVALMVLCVLLMPIVYVRSTLRRWIDRRAVVRRPPGASVPSVRPMRGRS